MDNRNSKPRHQGIRRLTIVAAALGMAVITLIASPGAANADQYRNGHWVFGAIEQEFIRFLNPDNSSRIGEPTSDELIAGSDGRGRWQEFGFTNRIVWSPDVDNSRGRQVGGLIMQKWLSLGDERARLGYPITAEEQAVGGRYNNFQGGGVTWQNGTLEAFATWGDIRATWGNSGWETGPYGFPSSNEFQCADDTASNGTYGGWGQTFANRTKYITAGADADGFDRQENALVNAAFNRLAYTGTTKYSDALTHAVNQWNGLGAIQVEQTPDPIFADITLSDVNMPGSGWVGVYSKSARTIKLNDAYLQAAPYNSQARRRHTVTHEFGHALGMGHSCQTQLMDPINSTVTNPQIIDTTTYNDMWGTP
ncbi:matrixin family metalloprotease [Nocardia fluminea]|uniref:matrixin family metalloprotease n=1 Tax=Nocardia fluminea TaxID=134984 RepID=UPI003D0E293E